MKKASLWALVIGVSAGIIAGIYEGVLTGVTAGIVITVIAFFAINRESKKPKEEEKADLSWRNIKSGKHFSRNIVTASDVARTRPRGGQPDHIIIVKEPVIVDNGSNLVNQLILTEELLMLDQQNGGGGGIGVSDQPQIEPEKVHGASGTWDNNGDGIKTDTIEMPRDTTAIDTVGQPTFEQPAAPAYEAPAPVQDFSSSIPDTSFTPDTSYTPDNNFSIDMN